MKNRLDEQIFERGLAESREKAKALVMAGIVYVNDQKAEKPGKSVSEDDTIEVRGSSCPYVSRGGLKLEKALKSFGIDAAGLTAIDIGASSGGFTDCLLQSGAKKVYSVDVGYAQLAYKLRIDERVTAFEKTNFRYMNFEAIGEKLDMAVMDVSFISIAKLAENLKDFLKDDALCIFLIKPQFEAEKGEVGKNGVIKDERLHAKILRKVLTSLAVLGFYVKKLDHSPIKGPKGNIEFIALFTFNKHDLIENLDETIDKCVRAAHEGLK